jgi:hypothetical protein
MPSRNIIFFPGASGALAFSDVTWITSEFEEDGAPIDTEDLTLREKGGGGGYYTVSHPGSAEVALRGYPTALGAGAEGRCVLQVPLTVQSMIDGGVAQSGMQYARWNPATVPTEFKYSKLSDGSINDPPTSVYFEARLIDESANGAHQAIYIKPNGTDAPADLGAYSPMSPVKWRQVDFVIETTSEEMPAGMVWIGDGSRAAVFMRIPTIPAGTSFTAVAGADGQPVISSMNDKLAIAVMTPLTAAQMIDGGIASESAPRAIEAAALAAAAGGGSGVPGGNPVTLTITDGIGGLLPNTRVWISSDAPGATIVDGPKLSKDDGTAVFTLTDGAHYYCWRRRAGTNFVNPQSFTAEAD